MKEVDQLNKERLSAYLASQISDPTIDLTGDMTVEKFDGGQSNPTFKITVANKSYVLRKQPPGKLLKSAHAVDREFRVISALYNTDVPVAKPYHLCTDTSVIGEMFYLMEFVEGNVYWDASLSTLPSNEQRTAIYDAMNKTLAAIHRINIDEVGLGDYGKPGNYFERQIARWIAQYRASELERIEEMDKLYDWLVQHLPADDGRVALVHGDYRLDNMMFAPNSSQILAVLDWELSTLGHPFADLAYQCMQLRLPRGMGGVDGLANIDRASLGIPSEQEYVTRYCQRMNINNIDHWPFYLAFSFFRLAAIIQGVAKRAAQGNASNKNAIKLGSLVKPLAQMALDVTRE